MEVVVTVEIQDGDECPQFRRTVEAEAPGDALREVIEAVNETGDAGQIYLVRLIQKGSAGETTLQTQRVIPEHKAYSLTLQEVSGGFLLAAHPTHTADVIRHIYATWEDAKQKFALHLGSDAAELEGLHKKLQSASVAHSVLQGHHLVTPEVVDALCK